MKELAVVLPLRVILADEMTDSFLGVSMIKVEEEIKAGTEVGVEPAVAGALAGKMGGFF